MTCHVKTIKFHNARFSRLCYGAVQMSVSKSDSEIKTDEKTSSNGDVGVARLALLSLCDVIQL